MVVCGSVVQRVKILGKYKYVTDKYKSLTVYDFLYETVEDACT